ncbi:TolC family protein [Persicobacter sp. CCB-QB2]|nr:TolC family protein [Persicobacter sp. CCB-QB2]
MLAKQSVKVEQANYLPKLSVQYGWQTVEGQSGFYQWQGGITLPLVFNAQKGRVKAAKKVAERTEAVQQEQLARLQGRLNQSKINFEKWQLSVSNYRQSLLPVAEEQIQAAQLAYEVGEIDYVTFIQNLDNAMQAYQAYYQALEQLLLAQIDLEYLLVTL